MVHLPQIVEEGEGERPHFSLSAWKQTKKRGGRGASKKVEEVWENAPGGDSGKGILMAPAKRWLAGCGDR